LSTEAPACRATVNRAQPIVATQLFDEENDAHAARPLPTHKDAEGKTCIAAQSEFNALDEMR
jgi:hypothetical protein